MDSPSMDLIVVSDVLCVTVVQGQDWEAVYLSTDICAARGSTVNISCTYSYPPTVTIRKQFWHAENRIDLMDEPAYRDRVTYICGNNNNCTVRITELKYSDSKTYYFRLIGERNPDKWTFTPGPSLKVTELSCHSSCSSPSYIWFKNGQKVHEDAAFYTGHLNPGDGVSCALRGHEDHRTPSLYAPKNFSVSVSPSGEIVEGSSVTLTCSSDANPAAKYTWYKGKQTLLQELQGCYHFAPISSEDRGIYYCKSENPHGEVKSSPQFIDVQCEYYSVKPTIYSLSPSAEIVEGSSVNLTCSSDANPAANYTWYKEGEDSSKASGQIFTITDFRAEHSGNYYCEAQNNRGRRNSTLNLAVVSDSSYVAVITATTAILITLLFLLVLLWIRKKRASKQPPEPVKGPDKRAQKQPAEEKSGLHYASVRFSKKQADPLYSNTTPYLVQTPKKEENVLYAAITFNNGNTLPGNNTQETGEDPAVLYSTVNKSSEKHGNQKL
ncbi:B-cell receptor CD22-like [Anoplopoma fimbria]|uniref:B-cell receptor CD22-like n=1 Tax=Anoplopoma fimbria TaxID=229290 RepID=UPI0023ED0DC0|nr:B-cell receptor CD22-like [Anoplopoma fimbria]